MKMRYLYGNIFTLASLQFSGHFLDHFVENSEKVVAFYILPRTGTKKNFIEVYEKGKLIAKKELFSPKNILLAYIVQYYQYVKILIRYFSKGEKIYFINFVPLFFIFNSILRLFRKFEIVYWIGDYWPMSGFQINIYKKLMHYYHDHCRYTIYLSDRINRKMNRGKLLDEKNKKTVMWGIDPKEMSERAKPAKSLILCFIGVLAPWQGIDFLLTVVKENKNVNLKLIGTGQPRLVAKFKTFVQKNNINDRVFFPNKFYYGEELKYIVLDCHAGIALYKVDQKSVIYYNDSAKIKQYTEFGLPVIITNATGTADFIKRFKAGIIVDSNQISVNSAIQKMREDYLDYLEGVKKFNERFNYKKYYKEAFQFLGQNR